LQLDLGHRGPTTFDRQAI